LAMLRGQVEGSLKSLLHFYSEFIRSHRSQAEG
jgi:hypothetical protein